jgi:hypothetical protein
VGAVGAELPGAPETADVLVLPVILMAGTGPPYARLVPTPPKLAGEMRDMKLPLELPPSGGDSDGKAMLGR